MSTSISPNSIELSGSITVGNIDAAYSALAEALRRPGPLVVNLDAVTDADLTFVQLIESLRRSAIAAGRAVSLAHPAGEAVREVLQRGGFLDDATSERTKFWLQRAVAQ